MYTSLETTTSSFLVHNLPLVVFGGLAILSLLLLILKPSRFSTLLFIGFLLLAINFEYEKHLYIKIKTDMLDLIFPEGTRFTKYSVINYALLYLIPFFMTFGGWIAVILASITRFHRDPR